MLLTEYDYEMDIAVQRAEEREIAFAEGIEQGIEQGKSLGLAEGARQKALETAKNLLAMGLPVENIVKATGLTAAEVAVLS